MTWNHHTISHYMDHCWLRSVLPYGVTRLTNQVKQHLHMFCPLWLSFIEGWLQWVQSEICSHTGVFIMNISQNKWPVITGPPCNMSLIDVIVEYSQASCRRPILQNVYEHIIQDLWKLMLFLYVKCWSPFAHTVLATLSWHEQNCVLIGSLESI